MKNFDIVIIGAGPVGLFTVFEAGLVNLKCALVDSLSQPGGQCIELYPEKPIYDIPGVPYQTAKQHVHALMDQIKPFKPTFFLDTDVDFVKRHELGNYAVTLSTGETLMTRNIFLASGPGKFIPRRPDVIGLADAEASNLVNFAVKNIDEIKGKDVIIFGGGDSAIDWALELQYKCKITLIHRSEKFKAVPANVDAVKNSESIRKFFGWKPEEIKENIVTINRKDEKIILKADKIFMFFGLLTDANLVQGLPEDIYNDNKRVPVDTEKFQSSTPGIFAVGDCNEYPGKLKLILSGFHETTLAVQEAYKRIHKSDPEFMYTTTSTVLQKKLNRNDNNN